MKQYLKQFPGQTGRLQDIVSLTAQLTGIPVAFITLMDKEVQWITVKHGFDVEQMPRNTSFCTHTIEQDDVMIVRDALRDDRFANNPLVMYAPLVKYYAGISLKSADGHNVGTLCAMDVKSHDLSDSHVESLRALSRQVTNIMELNLSIELLKKSVEQIESRNTALKKIAQVQSHDIREPLTSIMGVMNLIAAEGYPNNQEYLKHLESAVKRLDEKVCSIVKMSSSAHAVN